MGIPEKFQAVGWEGLIKVDGLEISVIILDARPCGGGADYLIEPTAGKGRMWLDSELIEVSEVRPRRLEIRLAACAGLVSYKS